MKTLIVSLLAIGIVGSLSGQNQKAKAPSPGGPFTTLSSDLVAGLESYENVVYAQYGDRSLALDLYRPKAAGKDKLPAIVCIHGGGWWKGNRFNHGRLAQALANEGYVTVTISYRLSGEAPFPAAIQDCKAAVRFLRAHADEYGIDADHIGAIGLSAGGHLTALLGSSGGVKEFEGGGGNAEQSSVIQAAVPLGAQADFSAEHIQAVKPVPPGGEMNLWVQFLGGAPVEVPEQYELASPLTHLNEGDPPTLFMAGEHDNDGTRAHSFREKMEVLGIPSDYIEIKDGPHPFLGRQKWFDETVVAATGWFDRYLKGK